MSGRLPQRRKMCRPRSAGSAGDASCANTSKRKPLCASGNDLASYSCFLIRRSRGLRSDVHVCPRIRAASTPKKRHSSSRLSLFALMWLCGGVVDARMNCKRTAKSSGSLSMNNRPCSSTECSNRPWKEMVGDRMGEAESGCGGVMIKGYELAFQVW